MLDFVFNKGASYGQSICKIFSKKTTTMKRKPTKMSAVCSKLRKTNEIFSKRWRI